ncbi:uncharacterized protein LOC143581335 [Bidens hawaiensis]|uniref:uncharacterized protein LOC143581335 n=1 Tax=Bidens hawaiensis TaxID=980011 RepID=UPI0040495DE9
MKVIPHEHPLKLIDLQEKLEESDEEEEVDDFDVTQEFLCTCKRCGEEINEYHKYYYKYSFCFFTIYVKCVVDEDIRRIHHPSHPHPLVSLLSKPILCECNACGKEHKGVFFLCTTCVDFTIHSSCIKLPKKTIRHVYDKHPMRLSYLPVETHKSEYFCEICENKLNPHYCFYHCDKCDQSMHSACAPLILSSETHTYTFYTRNVNMHLNLKFGGTH